jgi:hypothetical protein
VLDNLLTEIAEDSDVADRSSQNADLCIPRVSTAIFHGLTQNFEAQTFVHSTHFTKQALLCTHVCFTCSSYATPDMNSEVLLGKICGVCVVCCWHRVKFGPEICVRHLCLSHRNCEYEKCLTLQVYNNIFVSSVSQMTAASVSSSSLISVFV